MPEGLQEGDTGMMLQERIEGLESAVDELENIDVEDLKQTAVDDNYEVEEDEDGETPDTPSYDDLINDEDIDDSDKASVVEAFESALYDAISEAIECIVCD